MHIVCIGFQMVARQDTCLGVSIHETLSEDIPPLTHTLCTLFLTLHEALQVSTGW